MIQQETLLEATERTLLNCTTSQIKKFLENICRNKEKIQAFRHQLKNAGRDKKDFIREEIEDSFGEFDALVDNI